MKRTTLLQKAALLGFTLILTLAPCRCLEAATFTATPTAVSNTYAGPITFQIGGLTNGEFVVVQMFLDANTNGIIDAADWRVQHIPLFDGVPSVIGGVTNINVPADSTPTNGAITAQASFLTSGLGVPMTARYLYRLASPTTNFVAITNQVNVTNLPYAQSISGNVVCSGTNVPNALILAFAGRPFNSTPVAGAVADNAGGYRLPLPPGAYSVMAFQTTYVADATSAPSMVLGSGATVTTNLTLLPTTRSISGRVQDAANPTRGLPGIMILPFSTNNLAGLGFTDGNGNFTSQVTAGQWRVEYDDMQLPALGYADLADGPGADTTTGDATNVIIALPKGTALFYGTVKDVEGHPLPAVPLWAEEDQDVYDGSGVTDQNCNYAVAVVAGNWGIGPDTSESPAYEYYVSPFVYGIAMTNGQALRLDFVLLAATNRIFGYVTNSSGSGLGDVSVWAQTTIGGTNYEAETHTDGTGYYELQVCNGSWTAGLSCGDLSDLGYPCPGTRFTNILNNDAMVNFAVSVPCGPLQILSSSPLPAGEVGAPYSFYLQATSCYPTFSWWITDGSLPPGLDLNHSTGQILGMPETNGTFNFTVQVTDGNDTATTKGFYLTITPPPQDVATYSITKMESFWQSDATTVVPDNTHGPFSATLSIIQSDLDAVPIANVYLPGGGVRGFPWGGSGIELQVRDYFSSQAAMDAVYTNGDYTFALATQNNGFQFPVLTLPPAAYPAALRVSNYAAAQAINPAAPFTLQWVNPPDATSNDFIWVLILDNSGNMVFSTPYPPTDYLHSLRGTDASAVISNNVCQLGSTYTGVIVFWRVTSVNTTAYPGAVGMTLVGASTAFPMSAPSAPPPVLSQPVRISGTQFGFLLSGALGQNYTVLTATNATRPLSNWATVLVTNLTVSPTFIQDDHVSTLRRFYRVKVGP